MLPLDCCESVAVVLLCFGGEFFSVACCGCFPPDEVLFTRGTLADGLVAIS